jgi:predicted O-linked N-acetylglucosamine transferase (SPINDLY family)
MTERRKRPIALGRYNSLFKDPEHRGKSATIVCTLNESAPAPIQATYLGFQGTNGAEFFGYIFIDKIVMPPETKDCLSENAVYLPNTYQCITNTQ